MMVDYSKLSDFEINSAVSMAVRSQAANPESKYVVINDYCSNHADAWPIIVQNRISIINLDEDEWGARGVADRNSKRAIHENPLRAAMIVFLMMQEEK